MKTYTIGNLKGGVGKSTTTVNLAYSFSLLNQKVLVIDLDPQCNTTRFFSRVNTQGCSVKDVLEDPAHLKAYRTKYPNINIIRGSQHLKEAENEKRLSIALELVKEDYDLCLIDSRPVFDSLTKSGIYASDVLLTPIKFDNFCRDNLALVEDEYHQLLEENPELEWLVFANMVANGKAQRKVSEDLLSKHDYPVLDTCIGRSAAVDNALQLYKPVKKHRRHSNVAGDFMELAKELLER